MLMPTGLLLSLAYNSLAFVQWLPLQGAPWPGALLLHDTEVPRQAKGGGRAGVAHGSAAHPGLEDLRSW